MSLLESLPSSDETDSQEQHREPTTLQRILSSPNPCYVISTALVLLGIRLSLPASPHVNQAAIIFGIVVGYTVLLFVCTYLVARVIHVWDDARSLLMLHPVMVLSLSMLFDNLLISQPIAGCVLLLGGLAFALASSELLLRTLKIRLPLGYRGVYYTLLILLFVYPCVVSHWATDSHQREHILLMLHWFIPITSGLFLFLLPSIWRGERYVRENGTPYLFPLFPMSLFAILMPLVAFRLYLLALAFGPGRGDTVLLSPNAFIPLVLIAGILLLEIGVVTKSRSASIMAMATGPIMIYLVIASGSLYCPNYPAVWAPSLTHAIRLCLFFYSWARVRGVWGSHAALLMTLIPIGSLDDMGLPGLLCGWHLIPFLTGCIIELAMSLWHRSEFHLLLSGVFVGFAAVPIIAPPIIPSLMTTSEFLLGMSNAMAFYLLLICSARSMEWTHRIRLATIAGMVGNFAAGIVILPNSFGYFIIYIICLAGYGWIWVYRPALLGCVTCIFLSILAYSATMLERLRQTFLGAGLNYLIIGVAFLMIGLLISSVKSSVVRGWLNRHL